MKENSFRELNILKIDLRDAAPVFYYNIMMNLKFK